MADKIDATGDLYAHLDQPASGYEAWGGTSMATPHVAGVAALIWSSDPTLTNVEIREAMNETALDLGETGRDIYFGYGLVQAADAIDFLGGGPVNEAPVVNITSPTDGASFNTDENITFTGSASDDEDGNLSSELVWTSNIDGSLDTGASISASLSDGEHIITAEVTDTGGKTGSASIAIAVGTVQDPDTMSVSQIDMWYTKRGRNYSIYTQVTVTSNGQPVAGGTVTISLNGSITQGTTGSDGTVTFSYSTRSTGISTSTVTNVEHATFIWDKTRLHNHYQCPNRFFPITIKELPP